MVIKMYGLWRQLRAKSPMRPESASGVGIFDDALHGAKMFSIMFLFRYQQAN